jgi:predicted nucleic acid-binding protein
VKAVCNSSVLIGLSSIQRLELLSRRFDEGIWIPEAVWREVVVAGKDRPGADAVSAARWIHRATAPTGALLNLLQAELDTGEAEAIALALSENIGVVLLDEQEARAVARRMNLTVVGTIGLLIWARKRGILPSLRAELDALRQRGGFHLGDQVCQEALKAIGE